MELKTFPKYMYHRDHNEPIRVDSKAEQTDRENLGWTTARLFKEYPKWIGDKLVQSGVEEERLLAANKPAEDAPPPDVMFDEGFSVTSEDPRAVKETQVDGQDTATIKKPKEGSGRRKKK